jgi:hypothetical protein
MNYIDILTIIAISNLISEQSLPRSIVNKIFKPENYLNYSGYKRFFYDLLGCWSCLTVWISVIYMATKQVDLGLQYIYIPLIAMLLVDIIQKLKR